jgi:hypothetical protein
MASTTLRSTTAEGHTPLNEASSRPPRVPHVPHVDVPIVSILNVLCAAAAVIGSGMSNMVGAFLSVPFVVHIISVLSEHWAAAQCRLSFFLCRALDVMVDSIRPFSARFGLEHLLPPSIDFGPSTDLAKAHRAVPLYRTEEEIENDTSSSTLPETIRNRAEKTSEVEPAVGTKIE